MEFIGLLQEDFDEFDISHLYWGEYMEDHIKIHNPNNTWCVLKLNLTLREPLTQTQCYLRNLTGDYISLFT